MIVRRRPLRKRSNSDEAGFFQRRAPLRFSQIREEVRALSNIACILREDSFFKEAMRQIEGCTAARQLAGDAQEGSDTSVPDHQIVRSLEVH